MGNSGFRQVIRRLRVQRAGEKGQASILVGAMLLTFALFFAFVINTGMLVHAKINLQNAADMAAYAGAATQARQLTQISYLNYEMRRQWKKFLFRYYVLGNFAQATHPTAPTGVRIWKPNLQYTETFGVPTVCVNFDSQENVCQQGTISAIPIPRGGEADAITGALTEQLRRLEALRQGACKSIGAVNTILRDLWLFNTDPDLETVLQQMQAQGNGNNAQTIANATRAVRAMAAGLGIIPRLMILRKRIETLKEYVNVGGQTLNFEAANALKAQSGIQGPQWASLERPVQAYFSAFHTLGNHTFSDPENITLEEMLPPGANGEANLLALDDITTEFGMYSIDLATGTCDESAPPPPQPDGADCTQCLVPINFSRGFRPVVGVAKDPTVLTYYAVKLSAKAKLLFSPFGDITLTAYSAAQPFGSRIGPPRDQVFFSSAAPRPPQVRCLGLFCPERMPNLPVTANDPNEPTVSTGWNNNAVLFHFFQRFGQQNAGGGTNAVPPTITLRDMIRAYQVAMSPNPWESGKYNIPNDLTADPFVRTFSNRGIHAIWAPIVGPNSSGTGDLRDEIQRMIQSIASNDAVSQAAFTPEMRQALINGMDTYINRFLRNGDGEDGEGINIVRIFDPFKTREVDANGAPLPPQPIEGLPTSIVLNSDQADKVLTSWSNVNDAALRSKGRASYSVKYVPLRELTASSSITTDGASPFTNRLPASDDLAADIANVRH